MLSALLADADGTLVDTAKLIRHGQYEAAKRYLIECCLPEEDIPSYETYEQHLNEVVGGSTRETFERTIRLLYGDNSPHLEKMDFDKLNATLKPIQDELAPKYVTGFPGLSELLTYISANHLPFAIFTSGSPHHVVRNFGAALPELNSMDLFKKPGDDREKLTKFMQRIRDYYAIEQLAIITCEDVTHTKPHPEGLLVAAQQLGDIDVTRAAMIGDHTVDMQTAIAAKVSTRIGITHGFDDRKLLEDAGATRVIDSLSELEGILSKGTPHG